MKTTLLAAMIFLLALTSKPLHGAANAAPEQVVDTSGKKLRAGASYYIVPAATLNALGGLALSSIGEKECPLDVVAVDGYQGQPIVFTPVNVKKGVVRVSTDLNIYFPVETTCPQFTSLWKLDDYDYSTGQWFVTTGGAFANPGPQTINNWFKIEKYEEGYKLAYCPSVCKECSYQCSDIGIYEDQYGKRLALSDVPYKVQFQLAYNNN
ncbi:hypothetical protein RIF29_13762 [Crotalaria pallida]|uniref:Miraculin n=1 Tax=Crotalaria pallida TaxID=3830 RepID=A0AAN9IQ12_CROPI